MDVSRRSGNPFARYGFVDDRSRSRKSAASLRWLIVAAVFLAAGPAWGQTGSIAGTVTDTTQGVLPGVTVEVSSPALIEGVRTAITGGQGEFRLIDLRPGTYTATFSLSGFTSVERQDIEVNEGAVATVPVELTVGTLAETVVVTGATPVVDVQTTTQRRSLRREELDALPTARQMATYALLIPGSGADGQDVGGDFASGNSSIGTPRVGLHGSVPQDMMVFVEGMRAANVVSSGGCGTLHVNDAMIQEFALTTGAQGAEQENSGLQFNVVLKQGGNDFSGTLNGSFSGRGLQSSNLDDDLRARGVTSAIENAGVYDVHGGIGGAIVRDKVWFYGAYRTRGQDLFAPGAFHALDPDSPIFVPDPSRPAASTPRHQSVDFRVTAQTSANTRLSAYAVTNVSDNGAFFVGATRANEAAADFDSGFGDNVMSQFQFTWTPSDRVVVELGHTFGRNNFLFHPQDSVQPGVAGAFDVGTGIWSRAPLFLGIDLQSRQQNGKAIVNYVSGSHHLKIGTQWYGGWREQTNFNNASPAHGLILFTGFGLVGLPAALFQFMEPQTAKEVLGRNINFFVQETYTLNRLTLNAGLRYDHLNEYVPAQSAPAIPYAPAREFARIDNVPNWHDISPRLGVAYDLFGNQKTAVKFGVGRYVEAQGVQVPQQVNPLRSPVGNLTTRSWFDANQNLIPDCDLTNFGANQECGPIDNANFGQPIVPIAFDDDVASGWGKRVYNWEVQIGIEQEVIPGFAVEASYHRRWFGNHRVAVNKAVSPADFSEYCVTTPVDIRLSDGGGGEVCGFFDINPDAFARQDVLVEHASNFGDISQVYDGFDLLLDARLPNGLLIQGGVSVGRTRFDLCPALIGHPEIQSISPPWGAGFSSAAFSLASLSRTEEFCDMRPKFQPSVKVQAAYGLPWGLQTSVSFQSVQFPQNAWLTQVPGVRAERAYTNAEIAPSLGRDLSGGAQTATLQIQQAGQLYLDRITQLDWRFGRAFRINTTQIEPFLDIYNLFNDNAVTDANMTYGPNWLNADRVLGPRTLRFGIHMAF